MEWIDQNGYRPIGYRPIGYCREIDIECRPDHQWITEIRIAVERNEETQQ